MQVSGRLMAAARAVSVLLLLKAAVGGAGAALALSGVATDFLGVDLAQLSGWKVAGTGSIAGIILGVFAAIKGA